MTLEEREQNKKRMWLEGIGEQEKGKKRKKRKYAIITNNWGEQETDTNIDLGAIEHQQEQSREQPAPQPITEEQPTEE